MFAENLLLLPAIQYAVAVYVQDLIIIVEHARARKRYPVRDRGSYRRKGFRAAERAHQDKIAEIILRTWERASNAGV